jgi:hypothetical protein
MPALDGTGPAGMGPMTGGARGWCNPYSPLRIGARFAPYGLYGAPYAYQPPYSFRSYGWYPPVYGAGRPRWGRRGFWGRGMGRGGWGRGRRWW